MGRWPAMFQVDEVQQFFKEYVMYMVSTAVAISKLVLFVFFYPQINSEFLRITTVPLVSRFLSQLDRHSNCLIKVIKTKGGAIGQQTSQTLQIKVQSSKCFICQVHSITQGHSEQRNSYDMAGSNYIEQSQQMLDQVQNESEMSIQPDLSCRRSSSVLFLQLVSLAVDIMVEKKSSARLEKL